MSETALFLAWLMTEEAAWRRWETAGASLFSDERSANVEAYRRASRANTKARNAFIDRVEDECGLRDEAVT